MLKSAKIPVAAMALLGSCVISATLAPHTAHADSVWDHNGSVMLYQDSGKHRTIRYLNPKSSIQDLGVRDGTVLFRGERNGDRIHGVAYTFRAGCRPAPYHVDGTVYSETRVVLRGAAPIRAPGSCEIMGHSRLSPSATLVFEYMHQW